MKPKNKPTIEELERMMDEKGHGKIRLKPDGSIETIAPETEVEELARLRKEHSRLAIDLSEANRKLRKLREIAQALKEIL